MYDKQKLLEYHGRYLMKNYSPYPIIIAGGQGATLFDGDGNSYLDFLGGIAVNSLGYNNKELIKAINKQSKKILSCSNYFLNEPAILLARELIRGTHFDRAFFCNSGTEAAEAALKIVKKYNNEKKTGATKIISFENSFHGRTMGALSATGQDKYKTPFLPLLDDFVFIPFGDADRLESALKSKETYALITECIQGESGVITPTREYMSKLSALVKKHKKLLIVDEVQTGVGRTGDFFAYSGFGLKPDVIFTAKGLAGGLPIGAALASGELAETLQAGDHGTTFGGNPMSAAAALTVVKTIKGKGFLEDVTAKGDYLKRKLLELKSKFSFIEDVRGRGLIVGLELSKDVAAKDLNKKFLENGLILLAAGNNTLRFVPPLVVSVQEIDAACGIISRVFEKI
ncbi:MAG: acetylornithine/succinylornithine family transaminase [Clostridiales bacterium]|jgi:predicted acetylornithine/succinylornithine family transaminase|nr:acetylornithine/succinylornithine family transaminase [Clostridiales bacterium]